MGVVVIEGEGKPKEWQLLSCAGCMGMPGAWFCDPCERCGRVECLRCKQHPCVGCGHAS